MAIVTSSPDYIAQNRFDETRWRKSYPGVWTNILSGKVPGIASGWAYYINAADKTYGFIMGQTKPVIPMGARGPGVSGIPPTVVGGASIQTGAATPKPAQAGSCCPSCAQGKACEGKINLIPMGFGILVVVIVIAAFWKK